MTAAKAKVKYKYSPFPRRRESHPKLAAKEIPAFAGMERQRQRQKLNTAPIFNILDSRLRGNDGGRVGVGGKSAIPPQFIAEMAAILQIFHSCESRNQASFYTAKIYGFVRFCLAAKIKDT